jgi:hypothetical protein
MATLLVGTTSTECSACHRSAWPSQITHDVQYGYGPDNGTPGCGATFTHIVSTYYYWSEGGIDLGEKWCREKRPDLIYGNDLTPTV